MKIRQYHKGWLLSRIEKLDDSDIISTREIEDVTGISRQTLALWMKDKRFLNAGVAVKADDGFWLWSKDKLRLWIIAVVKIPKKQKGFEMNPPVDRDSAAEELGIPVGYQPQKGLFKKKEKKNADL